MTQASTQGALRRWLSGLVILAMALALFTLAPGTGASASTSDEIQDELDDLNDQKSEIQDKMNEIQAEIDSLEYEQSNTLEKKLILDQKNQYAQEELDVIQEQIDISDGYMASMQEDLEEARAEEAYQRERWLTRVRAMEESSDVDYLQVIFDSTSFSDLLTRMDLVGDVMGYDEQLEAEYIAARSNVEALESKAEALYLDNQARRQELETKKAQLETDIAAACELMASMEANADEYEDVLAMEAEAEAELQELITSKEKELQKAKQEEEAARLAQLAAQQAAAGQSAGVSVSGAAWMMWPSYTKLLTSKFGPRYLKLYGYTRSHNGVDIGASYGTNIWAAAGGTVISAGWNGGYGNCVVINHGNGYTTLYGHMSKVAVSAGQTVSMGQVIGYVGSTGNSTGPHIHFEIRASATATPINPLAFAYLT